MKYHQEFYPNDPPFFIAHSGLNIERANMEKQRGRGLSIILTPGFNWYYNYSPLKDEMKNRRRWNLSSEDKVRQSAAKHFNACANHFIAHTGIRFSVTYHFIAHRGLSVEGTKK